MSSRPRPSGPQRETKPKKEEPKADVRAQFFSAIRSEKLEILRNCLSTGNVTNATRDDDDHTGIHLAAATNKQRSLRTLIEHIDLRNDSKLLELTDEGGRTALMMAAANGHLSCVKELIRADAKIDAKDRKGQLAKDYAEKRGHVEVLQYLLEQMKVDEGEAAVDDGDETSTQRNRRLRKELEAKESRGLAAKAKGASTPGSQEVDSGSQAEAEAAPVITEARWPEVKKLLEERKSEITINRSEDKEVGSPVVDPALWSCLSLNRLQLRLPPGVFVELPSEISRLSNMTALILKNNSLSSLPESIGKLPNLKILEVEANKISYLPASMSCLTKLEVLNASYNQIASVSSLSTSTSLVSLSLDVNKIQSIEELPFESMERLSNFSASGNQIVEIPTTIEKLQNMSSLNLKDNMIEDLPREMGNLTEKKLKVLNLEGNPLSDKRALKILQTGRVPIKDLLQHLRKQAPKKGKKGKKSAAQDDDESEDEEEQDDE